MTTPVETLLELLPNHELDCAQIAAMRKGEWSDTWHSECYECGYRKPQTKFEHVRIHATDNEGLRSTVTMCRNCARNYRAGTINYDSKEAIWTPK